MVLSRKHAKNRGSVRRYNSRTFIYRHAASYLLPVERQRLLDIDGNAQSNVIGHHRQHEADPR